MNPRRKTLIETTRSLRTLSQNWDGDGAPLLYPEAINQAVDTLLCLPASILPLVSVHPLGCGGVQIEWVRNGILTEMQFCKTDLVSVREQEKKPLAWESPLEK